VKSGGERLVAARREQESTLRLAQVKLLTLRYRRGIGVPMGPIVQETATGTGAPQSGAAPATGADGKETDRAYFAGSVKSPASPAEGRPDERLGRVLGQKRGPDAVITAVLCAALLSLVGMDATGVWSRSTVGWFAAAG
jgi:hypothetical protein